MTFTSSSCPVFSWRASLKFRPLVGAILNLTPDHMDRYRDLAAYIGAKQRIFMNQTASDFAVLNRDDPRTAAMAGQVCAAPVLLQPPGRSRARNLHASRTPGLPQSRGCRRTCLPPRDIRLKGSHNLENVLAASAMALLAGAAPGSLEGVVRAFTGVEHRLEWVAEIDGVQYFNDSKATNVDAAIKSLEAFPRNILLIAGGRDKGGDFMPLRPLVAQRVKHLILIGEAAGKIREALVGRRGDERCRKPSRSGPACRPEGSPGRHRPAGAGLRQLRHVSELRTPRPCLQGGRARHDAGNRREVPWPTSPAVTGSCSSPPACSPLSGWSWSTAPPPSLASDKHAGDSAYFFLRQLHLRRGRLCA